MEEYLKQRHSILIEILRHESHPSQPFCAICQEPSGLYRCRDCFGPNLRCGECCVSAHVHAPFHRVQMWNGRFFQESDLLTRNLTMDLTHYPDDCPSIPSYNDTEIMNDLDNSDEADECADGHLPSQSSSSTGSRSTLTIVASTGIFRRSIRWCHCAKSSKQYVQLLLRAKLFPASFKNPKTAFTFEVLDQFRLDALECKTSAMNFMSKIGRITDEAFPSRVPVGLPTHRITFSVSSDCVGSLSGATPSVQTVAGSSQSNESWSCL
jgi:hypothetical protein